MLDIHNYKRRLERILDKIKTSKDISEQNRDILMRFYHACSADGLSICKIERYLYDLCRFSQMLGKTLSEATKDDLQRVVAEIEAKEWSPQSKQTFKVMMKKFYKWLEGTDGNYPEKIKWLKTNLKNNHKKLPDELLTEDDIENLIRHAENTRDRAFISVLYESGCRIGELGNMQIKDIYFDEFGAKLNVTGKTGARIIRIVNSAPYLQEWINKHPQNQNLGSYVWVGNNGKPVSYTRLASIIKSLAKRAEIKKRIHPHLFRHSRASYLAQFITESQMKNYLGWTQSSDMASIYVHLNDTDNAILRMNGLKKESEKEEQKLKPKQCLRCKTINESTNRFCKACAFILDKEEADKLIETDLKRKEADDIMNKLIKDPEILELIKKKLSD